ncbi:MAG: hypothetical protein J6P90_05130 [Rikenellaceae bacterium]|nr:hypothetical protein [Rikenellaceae bacterium]
MDENKEKKIKYKNPFVDESAFEGDDTPKKSEDEVLMDQAKQHTEIVEVKTYMALGMVIGLAAGAVVGLFFPGRTNVFAGIGMLVGLITGTCIHKNPKDTKNSN